MSVRTPVSTAALSVLLVIVASCTQPTTTAENESAEQATPTSEPTERPTARPTQRPTPRPTPSAVPRADLEVAEYGFSTYQGQYDDGANLSWAVVIENPNAANSWLATSTDVRVSFFDVGGGVIASTSDTIALVLPSGKGAVVGSESYMSNSDLELVETMEVRLGEPAWEEADGPVGSFTTSGVQVRADDFGVTTTGTIESTFADEIEDAYGTAVYRDAAGAIIGGDFTFIDFIEPGESTPFEISGFSAPPAVTSAEVYVTFSFLSF